MLQDWIDLAKTILVFLVGVLSYVIGLLLVGSGLFGIFSTNNPKPSLFVIIFLGLIFCRLSRWFYIRCTL